MEAIKLFTTEQIRSIEKHAMEEFNIPELLLMENAAMALFSLIDEKFKDYKVVICIGPGNNGGDGLALSRILYSRGWDVYNFFLKKPNFSGASKTNYIASKHVPVIDTLILDNKTLVIDALFGTGLSREFDNKTKELIEIINRSKSKVISVDIPSGISGLNGKIVGKVAVEADYTVTFCSNKLGLYLYPGYACCGEIIQSTISIPPEVINSTRSDYFLNSKIIYPKRENPCHKTSYGRVLILSGSKNYYGAPLFASKASLLSGSGYTTLCTNKDVIKSISSTLPEVIYRESSDYLNELKLATFVVYGPGLGKEADIEVLKSILKTSKVDLLIDGDGLKLLKGLKKELQSYQGNIIITPHPKEAANLLDKTTNYILDNQIESATNLSREYSAITVLKGSNSIISGKAGDIFINTTGSTALSTAGSGDILCGIIAGLSGYMSVFNAVKSGVYIHGRMGEAGTNKVRSVGITAMDLLNLIPKVVVPS